MYPYELLRRVGEGSFSRVFSAKKLTTGKSSFAMKMIKRIDHAEEYYSIEVKVLRRMTRNLEIGFPKLVWNGLLPGGWTIIMSLLGESLLDRWPRIALSAVAPQMIARIRTLHQYGFLHRDQKPNNWLFGLGRNSRVIHLIDFGLSTSYVINGQHVLHHETRSFHGTHLYCSPYPQLGYNESRRDDLISLGYVLISLYQPLPWNNGQYDSSEAKWIAAEKLEAEYSQRVPVMLLEYLNRCLKLGFYDEPPYEELIHLLE